MTALAYHWRMSTHRTIVAVTALALTIAACESDDDSGATAATVPAAVTTSVTEPPTTTDASSSSEGEAPATPATTSATTEKPFADNVAVVWRSSVDSNRVNTQQPPPRWDVSETTVALDIVGIVANDPTAGSIGRACEDAIELEGTDDEQCMFVQFRFDVGSDATERGGIFVPHVITAEGEQIDVFASLSAWDDTVDNLLSFVVPGAGPGSTIVFTVNGGLGVADLELNIEFVTPDAAEWKPVDFLGD